jgi:hypothetical protein
MVTDLPVTEVNSTPVQPVLIQPQAAPIDYEEFLTNEIDYLMNKIESKLKSTNINP